MYQRLLPIFSYGNKAMLLSHCIKHWWWRGHQCQVINKHFIIGLPGNIIMGVDQSLENRICSYYDSCCHIQKSVIVVTAFITFRQISLLGQLFQIYNSIIIFTVVSLQCASSPTSQHWMSQVWSSSPIKPQKLP